MASIGSLLILRPGGEPSGSLPLHANEEVTIGRAPDSGVRIRLASIPLLAARLVAEGARAFLVCETTSSAASLHRSGAPVPLPLGVPVCLEHRDTLTFSARAFMFEYGACGGWRGRAAALSPLTPSCARTP